MTRITLPSFSRFSVAGILVILFVLGACKGPKTSQTSQVPIFDGFDTFGMEVTTQSELAQRYFDQGLSLSYGFNHLEAARSFRESFRLDSTCAMCYWGLAYVLGPNYNAGMDKADVEEAYWAIGKAQEHASLATPWEQAVISATSKRYGPNREDDRAALDQAYADALRVAYTQFPDNADIGALFAESLMGLHPWDLWQRDGTPQPWTPEILETLEKALETNPKQPAANHFYIHAVEASQQPELGVKQAKLLETLVPGSGHLVHMPSHIYIRTGQYHEGSLVNERAIVLDSLYVDRVKATGMVPYAYFPHNIHFLAATAALEGRGETSVNAAFRLADKIDPKVMMDPAWGTTQHFFSIPYFVLVKFGQWDHILRMEMPEDTFAYPRAILHYARGMAFSAKESWDLAETEFNLLKEIQADSAIDGITIWDINTARSVVEVAALVLEAELAWGMGDKDDAIALLKEAIEKEDNLNYNEPPDWFFSVRHTLGDFYLQLDKFAEAEAVYREDLSIYPENGYALNGLHQALSSMGKTEEAESVKTRFEKAWQYADVRLDGSLVKHLVTKRFELERDLAMAGNSSDQYYDNFTYCIPTR